MKQPSYKSYRAKVINQNGQTRMKFDLEKSVGRVTGLAISGDAFNLPFARGLVQIAIGGVTLYQDGFEAKMLMCGTTVKPNEKFQDLDQPPGNGLIEMVYTDFDTANVAYPVGGYWVTLHVRSELK